MAIGVVGGVILSAAIIAVMGPGAFGMLVAYAVGLQVGQPPVG